MKGLTIYYSNNNIDWIETNTIHHIDSVTTILKNYCNKYNKNGYVYELVRYDDNTFIILKEKNQYAFLRYIISYNYKIANKDITINYLGKNIIIKQNSGYYEDPINCTPVIGWHASYDPPRDMDGNIVKNISIESKNRLNLKID